MFENWKILVVGAGTMGHSIAITYALNGFETIVYDQNLEQFEKAKIMVAGNLQTLASVGEISEDSIQRAQKMISYTNKLEEVAPQANLVVESIFESPEAKREIFSRLNKLCSPDTIFTSNTSALNIFEIAEISHPERLVIAHWFNPPHMMPLVEVVRGPQTSDQTVETVVALLTKLGKTPAVINQYIPGFIVNRFSAVTAREAGYMIDQGWCTWEDIDSAIVNTFGLRWAFEGPLESRDFIGWDISTTNSKTLFPQLCNTGDPMPLAMEMVEKGTLGVKTGKGLKDYSNQDVQKIQKDRTMKIFKMLKVTREL